MSTTDEGPQAALIVESELRELARVSAWVHDWAALEQLPTRLAQRIDLCSTEVVTNVMTHAAADGTQRIFLGLAWQGEEVALDVEDEGCEFDPREVPEPVPATCLRDAHIGGWGIPIVRRFSDDMHYHHRDGCNCLTLFFQTSSSTTEE
jgi:serine/threonine-protein kinase RsbW